MKAAVLACYFGVWRAVPSECLSRRGSRRGDGWIVFACLVTLTLCGCGQSMTAPSDEQASGERNGVVTVELVSIPPFSGEKVRLMLKVTNVSKRDIVRAKALVTALDADGNALGSKSTYLIQSQKGGLAPGASVEEDAIIDVSDKTKVVGMTCEMENIRFKE